MNTTWHWAGNKRTVAVFDLDPLGIEGVSEIRNFKLRGVSAQEANLIDISLLVKGVWGKPALGSGEAFFEVTNDNEIMAVLRSSNRLQWV